jgi:hypothetical protein
VSAGGAEQLLQKVPRRGESSSVGGAVVSMRGASSVAAGSTAWVADNVQSTPVRAIREKTVSRSRNSFGIRTPGVRNDDLYADTPLYPGKILFHIKTCF